MDVDEPNELGKTAVTEGSDAHIIFHPPRGSKMGPGQRSCCTNKLFEQVRLARVGSGSATTMQLKFQPTETWYKEQRDEGRALEHLVVSPWQSVFNKHKIPLATGNLPRAEDALATDLAGKGPDASPEDTDRTNIQPK
jgi:hypothetical protein